MFSSPLKVVLVVLSAAAVFGFFVLGHLLYKAPVGLAPSAFLAGDAIQSVFPSKNASGGIFWLVVSALAVLVGSFVVVSRSVKAKVAATNPGRRSFLTGAGTGAGVAIGSVVVSAAAGAARAFQGLGTGTGGWKDMTLIMDGDVPFTHPEPKAEWKQSRVQDYRRFGRTEWNVSDIVLGTGRIKLEEGGEAIARAALERGINYFDTSPDYSGAGSENAMGKAIEGVRDELFIATKFCTPVGHLPAGTPVAHYMEAVEQSLARLGTDRVDLCHIHSVNTVDRLMDPNVHEAFDRLKEQGKVRFLGFSTHTPNLLEVANAGIDSGRFDVMMLAYHHGIWAPMNDVIHRARTEQDMGVVAMKTLKGAKHRGLMDFQPYADTYVQAALKWTLSNPDVSCAVISFFKPEHVDEYLAASGQRLSPDEMEVLAEYDRQILGSYCQPHCGACLDKCPEQVAIHDVLRHRMYFEDYGWEKEAMGLYAQLTPNAEACVGCSAPCAGSCPVGIPIQERTTGAHELLTVS